MYAWRRWKFQTICHLPNAFNNQERIEELLLKLIGVARSGWLLAVTMKRHEHQIAYLVRYHTTVDVCLVFHVLNSLVKVKSYIL